MSSFDAETFENMVMEDTNATEFTPVPEGDYTAMIDSQRIKIIDIKNGARAGTSVPVLEIVYSITDDDGKLKEELNREKITVRQDIWLDLNENGTIGFGPNQNVGLGRLREAAGLNKPGKAFSFGMLEGMGPLEIHVSNETYEDRVYDRVTRVAAG